MLQEPKQLPLLWVTPREERFIACLPMLCLDVCVFGHRYAYVRVVLLRVTEIGDENDGGGFTLYGVQDL